MNLIPSDEYSASAPAILTAYGQVVVPPRTGNPGRPQAPYQVAPPELPYATVHKTREKGRGVQVACRVVFGAALAGLAARARSQVSKALNPAFSARQNGTDPNRTARKVRKRYCFSKNWEVHAAVTYCTLSSYNFCWPVRTLRMKAADGRGQQRTPAMAAGLADHIWTLSEWLTFPGVQRK